MCKCNSLLQFPLHALHNTTDKPLKCGCSGELEMDEEIIAVAVKVVKGGTEPDMVQKEIDTLAAVRGMPHFIQDVDPKYHQRGDETCALFIDTRYAQNTFHCLFVTCGDMTIAEHHSSLPQLSRSSKGESAAIVTDSVYMHCQVSDLTASVCRLCPDSNVSKLHCIADRLVEGILLGHFRSWLWSKRNEPGGHGRLRRAVRRIYSQLAKVKHTSRVPLLHILTRPACVEQQVKLPVQTLAWDLSMLTSNDVLGFNTNCSIRHGKP